MGKIAYLFAGQGAQHAGMGQAFYDASPAAREILNAAEAMRPGTLDQCFNGDKTTLSTTVNTQPCLFAVDLACAAAAREAGIPMHAAAGFSLGEVAAAAFTEMLSFKEAFRLVLRRAETMQACADMHPGAMVAVLKLDNDTIGSICAEFDEAWPVNYNSPGQTVVACAADVLAPLSDHIKAAGGRAMRLNVSGGFHTPWMQPATDALTEMLIGIPLAAPSVPLYANRTALPYAAETAAETLAKQASSPVRWTDTIQNMIADGIDTFIEFGPGNTLTGLVRRIAPEATALNVEDPEGLKKCLEALAAKEAANA